ncbi:MAG: formylglycine-generating enzyme family protein [Pirellulaceae bacterium]|nr:formylglycine-generating enzyme family protein [Pirellulaceae bacterium]
MRRSLDNRVRKIVVGALRRAASFTPRIVVLFGVVFSGVGAPAQETAQTKAPKLDVPGSEAQEASQMKAYKELIEHTEATIEMLPIPGGKFQMGSPDSQPGHKPDEAPVHEVELSPFWMAKTELTWDAYDVWAADLDLYRREVLGTPPSPRDKLADVFQISQPTKPYTDMSFGMGKRDFPAICMTQHAARTFCKWLSAKTGRYYRLPTEAEWEYACRAGTTTAYHFGDDADKLGDYAWYVDNAGEGYHKVGRKKANAWGLHDMHGNVAEWVLDQHFEAGYTASAIAKQKKDPLAVPQELYPRVVRGGGWNQEAAQCRSAAREGSTEDWIAQDPQVPVSIWYLTDALHVGFRIVRPLNEPSEEEKNKHWEMSLPVQVERTTAKVE